MKPLGLDQKGQEEGVVIGTRREGYCTGDRAAASSGQPLRDGAGEISTHTSPSDLLQGLLIGKRQQQTREQEGPLILSMQVSSQDPRAERGRMESRSGGANGICTALATLALSIQVLLLLPGLHG